MTGQSQPQNHPGRQSPALSVATHPRFRATSAQIPYHLFPHKCESKLIPLRLLSKPDPLKLGSGLGIEASRQSAPAGGTSSLRPAGGKKTGAKKSLRACCRSVRVRADRIPGRYWPGPWPDFPHYKAARRCRTSAPRRRSGPGPRTASAPGRRRASAPRRSTGTPAAG